MSKAANTMGQNEALMEFNLYEVTPTVIALGAVVLAQMLCAMCLVVLVLRAWVIRQSTIRIRIALTLVTLAGVIFWFFYFRWGFVSIFFNVLG